MKLQDRLAYIRALINTLRPGQNGRHFSDDIFKCIFVNENVWIPIKISMRFVPKGPINNIPALVQIMAWRRPDDKPLSEPMMVSLTTHICVCRPLWVKKTIYGQRQSSNYIRMSVPLQLHRICAAIGKDDLIRMYGKKFKTRGSNKLDITVICTGIHR